MFRRPIAILPRIDYVGRVARATGQPITLTFDREDTSRADLRRRVRRALGSRRFDPRERDLAPIEVRSLDADGLAQGSARMIGLDVLYLDRLRQATMLVSHEGTEFLSALAVAAARMDAFDMRFLADRLSAIEASEPQIGAAMRRIDRRIRARVRRSL